MRPIYLIVIFSFFLACSEKQKENQNHSLEDKRELLKTKKAQISELEREVEMLTSELLENDPDLVKKKKNVSTLKIETSDYVKYINLEGIVIANDVVNAVSEIPGRLLSLYAKEGDIIKKGAKIASLDIQNLKTQKQEIITNLDLAKTLYDKRAKLWAKDIGSEVEYLEAKNTVDRLEKALESVDLQIDKGSVKSPISGVVDREITKQGEVVSPGMPIMTILNTKNLKVKVDLPERYLTKIKKGMELNVHFPSLDLDIPGNISLLGRSIDPANRTLKFEVSIPNEGGILKPNLLAEIKIEETKVENAITIPLEMVQQDVNNQSFVMRVNNKDSESRAEKIEILLGDVNQGIALIEEGVKENDILIKDGARLVSDGEMIQIIDEKVEDE